MTAVCVPGQSCIGTIWLRFPKEGQVGRIPEMDKARVSASLTDEGFDAACRPVDSHLELALLSSRCLLASFVCRGKGNI